jgi:hypothetical protein
VIQIATQHGVHPTGGSLRVFRQFSWLGVGSVLIMQIPNSAQALINRELEQLAKSSKYSLHPESRVEIYAALGASSVNDDRILDEARRNNALPHLSIADRVRAQIALITAQKVLPLWEIACQESEAFFTEEDWQAKYEDQRQEEVYLRKRKTQPIETISVYDVPRAFTPFHILEMAEVALAGEIHDYDEFRRAASEWWQIYGRPEQMEREFYIKWAAQDALYEAIGWIKHNPEPPAENALYAFAGVFEGDGFNNRSWTFDEHKQHEFWVWWLSEAIPLAHERVS